MEFGGDGLGGLLFSLPPPLGADAIFHTITIDG
jgi:hypothetical protein